MHRDARMKTLGLLVTMVLAGCWGPPVAQAPECRAWVACVRAQDEARGETTDLERFVEGGFCWNNSTLAEGCTTACGRALERVRAREPGAPPECQP